MTHPEESIGHIVVEFGGRRREVTAERSGKRWDQGRDLPRLRLEDISGTPRRAAGRDRRVGGDDKAPEVVRRQG